MYSTAERLDMIPGINTDCKQKVFNLNLLLTGYVILVQVHPLQLQSLHLKHERGILDNIITVEVLKKNQ